jgi:hypothetical protein
MSSKGPRKPPPPPIPPRSLAPPPISSTTTTTAPQRQPPPPPPSRRPPPPPPRTPPPTTAPSPGLGGATSVSTALTTMGGAIKNAPKAPVIPQAPAPPVSADIAKRIAQELLEAHQSAWEKHTVAQLPDSAPFEAELKTSILRDIAASGKPDEQTSDAASVIDKIIKVEGAAHIKTVYAAKAEEIVSTTIAAEANEIGDKKFYPSPEKKTRTEVGKEVKAVIPALKSGMTATAQDPATVDDLKTKIVAKSGTMATAELTTLEAKDPTLAIVSDPFINTLVTKQFTEPLTTTTAFKLGAVKRYLRRDKDGKAYRQDLKDAVRDKAAEEIHTEVGTKPNLSDTMKEFYEGKAQGIAYKDVKKFVDEVTLKKAKDIATPLVTPHIGDVKTAARQALYAKIRTGGHMFEWRMRQVAAAGGKAKIDAVFEAAKTFAHAQAAEERTDVTKKTKVKEDITSKVDQSYAAGVVKAAIESSDIGKGWQVIGGIIDAAVPNIGGKAKLDLQLKIPVFKGVFITFQFVGEAERENYMKKDRTRVLPSGKFAKTMKELLKTRIEFTTGLGGGMPGLFDLVAQFGGFLEAQASDSTRLCMMMSYAMYRKMKDYTGLAPMALRIWGQGGTTRKLNKTTGKATGGTYTREEEAELWAAMVEEQAMGEKQAYADIGLLGKAKAGINAGVGKAETELKLGGGTRYSGYMFDGGSGAGATKGKTGKTSSQIAAASSGARMFAAELGGKIEVEGPSIAAELKGKILVLEDTVAKEMKFMGGELEGEFQVQSVGGKEGKATQDLIAKLITNATAFGGNLKGQLRGRATTAAQKVGTAVRMGEDGVLAADGFAQAFDSSFTEGIKNLPQVKDQVTGQSESMLGLKSSLGLNIKFTSYRKKLNPASPKFDKTLDLSLLTAKGLKINAGVFQGELEVKQRIAGYSSDGRFGALGFGTM